MVSVNEMMGATSLMQEDILMAGYASFIGLTMAFPVLFRLKFRFPTRTILPAVAIGLIVCNLVTMQTRNLPLLYRAQNETYMCRSAENVVKSLCFNKLCAVG